MKTIFFDFNGTILDDVALCIRLLNEMLIEQEKSPVTKEEYLEIFGFPVQNYYERAGIDFKIRSFQDLSKQFIKEYMAAYPTEAEIMPGLLSTVKSIKSLGFRVVVCSASMLSNLIEQLRYYDILDVFDDVIGIQDIYAKSKVEVARQYIQEHHTPIEESYFIGDTDHDFEVSIELGLTSVLVANGHQSAKRLKALHENVVETITDILPIILSSKKV